jgi:hypothetical protein
VGLRVWSWEGLGVSRRRWCPSGSGPRPARGLRPLRGRGPRARGKETSFFSPPAKAARRKFPGAEERANPYLKGLDPYLPQIGGERCGRRHLTREKEASIFLELGSSKTGKEIFSETGVKILKLERRS